MLPPFLQARAFRAVPVSVLAVALVASAACSMNDSGSSTAAASDEHFPYDFTPEPDVPASRSVRAEGMSTHDITLKIVPYFEKLFRKKYTAPVEEVRHFDAQRALYKALESQRPTDAPDTHARVGFVGDVMWVRDHWDSFARPDVLGELGRNDALFGNLETPIAESRPVPGLLPDYASYNGSPDLLRSFKWNGRPLFSAVSTANNHAFDQGDPGAVETARFLDTEGVLRSGVRTTSQEKTYVTYTAGGLRFGYYATTWGFNDTLHPPDGTEMLPSWLKGLVPEEVNASHRDVDLESVATALRDMDRDGVDFKLVSLHWGHEYEFYPTPVQMQLARSVIGLGADVIIGAHPHVQQPNEVCFVNGYDSGLGEAALARSQGASCDVTTADGGKRKALVMYSLGNFATDMWSFLCEMGMIESVEFVKGSDGTRDWRLPSHTFVHNLRFSRDHDRRLELLSTFLSGRCDGAGCSDAVLAYVDFLERHITGSHLEDGEIRTLDRNGFAESRVLLNELRQTLLTLDAEARAFALRLIVALQQMVMDDE
jgi:poly-gamma-glutamate synthesis protein (capsule biosynthesis protein)